MVNFNAEKTNKERCNGLRRCACIVAPRRKDDQGTAQQKTSDILKDNEPEGAWLEGLGKESKITCLLCHVRGLHILPTFFVEYEEKTPRAQLVVLVFRSEFLSFAVNCSSENGIGIFRKYTFLLRGTWFQSNKAGSLLTKHREKYSNANRKDENLVMQAGVKQ